MQCIFFLFFGIWVHRFGVWMNLIALFIKKVIAGYDLGFVNVPRVMDLQERLPITAIYLSGVNSFKWIYFG